MQKRTLLLIILLAAATLGISAVWVLGSILSAPAARSLGAAPAHLNVRSVSFGSASGSTLHGWFVQGVPGHGALVLAHSVRSNRLEMVDRAAFLHQAGYSVLLFDAQSHGESPGRHITFGYLESLDARAAVSFLRSQEPMGKIGYLGVSQGGAAALIGTPPLEVQALILEAVYPTLREAIVDRIRIRLGPLAPLLAPLLLAQIEPRLGVDPDSIAPIEGIRRIRAPVLLIAGERDKHTLLSESKRLFDAAPEPKALWVVPGAAHVNFHRAAPVEYEHRILEFLTRAFGEGAT